MVGPLLGVGGRRGAVSGSKDRDSRTSAGVLWSEVPEHAVQYVEYIEGRHGPSTRPLPGLEEFPVPQALLDLPDRHPDRPTGSKAMLDAAGAKARLDGCRPGAWLISPLTGWWWAKWPDGSVWWIPEHTELPTELFITARDDLQ